MADREFIARTIGVGPFKAIQLGKYFDSLSDPEKLAVIYHEQAHIEFGHAWQRIKWLFTVPWASIPERCVQQEYEADDYVARKGYEFGLWSFLDKARMLSHSGGIFHPSPEDRIDRLSKLGEQHE